MSGKVWGGRFKEEADALVDEFNASIDFDRRLYEQDILGSMAHCRMMGNQGILSEDETSAIVEALERSRERWPTEGYPSAGTMKISTLLWSGP